MWKISDHTHAEMTPTRANQQKATTKLINHGRTTDRELWMFCRIQGKFTRDTHTHTWFGILRTFPRNVSGHTYSRKLREGNRYAHQYHPLNVGHDNHMIFVYKLTGPKKSLEGQRGKAGSKKTTKVKPGWRCMLPRLELWFAGLWHVCYFVVVSNRCSADICRK